MVWIVESLWLHTYIPHATVIVQQLVCRWGCTEVGVRVGKKQCNLEWNKSSDRWGILRCLVSYILQKEQYVQITPLFVELLSKSIGKRPKRWAWKSWEIFNTNSILDFIRTCEDPLDDDLSIRYAHWLPFGGRWCRHKTQRLPYVSRRAFLTERGKEAWESPMFSGSCWRDSCYEPRSRSS